MIQLSADEARVLGVLIEKAQTTPEQYPLSLNAIVAGASQKNNRDPVISFDDDRARTAVDALREKGLVIQVDQVSSRVHKYKHVAGEKLAARTAEVVLLAEMMLRGPQTLGELRGRASRMHPMETMDAAMEMLRALMERPEPLARQIAPLPGSRAERFMQLLSPELHAVEAAEQSAVGETSAGPSLAARVERLEEQVASLRQQVEHLSGSQETSAKAP